MYIRKSGEEAMEQTAELIIGTPSILGEGCIWDYKRQRLLFVDIEKCRVYIYDPEKRHLRHIDVGQRVGTVVPSQDGKLVVALEKSVAELDPATERLEIVAEIEKDVPGNRFNDGKCDPAGRFWVGTVVEDMSQPRAGLYRVDSDYSVKQMLAGVTNSNGIVWSLDQTKLYYIDSGTRRVVSFDYDLASGDIENRRPVVELPASMGLPDGMTIDAEGKLWVALFGGAAVTRWDPENGRLIDLYPIPAKHVTSCAFGGENLDELYVTTAQFLMTAADITAYPQSGGLFRLKLKTRGVPCFEFKTDKS
jgi:sugar lactone lactonase YvrE